MSTNRKNTVHKKASLRELKKLDSARRARINDLEDRARKLAEEFLNDMDDTEVEVDRLITAILDTAVRHAYFRAVKRCREDEQRRTPNEQSRWQGGV